MNVMDERNDRLDLVLEVDGTIRDAAQPQDTNRTAVGRPWIGIHFECCGVYTRVYRQPADARYEGRCPKCGVRVNLRVGPDGIASRTFVARPG